MSCSASCKMFETLSNALQWIASSKLHIRNISHILDDFLLLARDKAVGQVQLSSFLSMCADIGIPIAPDKTVQPTQVITFLGLELDSVAMEVRLPVDKLNRCTTLIETCLKKDKILYHHTYQPMGTYINYKGGRGGCDSTITFLVQKLLSACHKISKHFYLRMPIDKPMLSKLLGALEFTVPGKHHRALYKAMSCLTFHAFLRTGEMTEQSDNAANPNLLQWKQPEIKDTSLTGTFIHFKHSKGNPLSRTIKCTTSPQDCPLQIMMAYLSVRGATAGTVFLYCPSVSVTRAKFNEQLRGVLQFCHFCPKQFKSHSLRIGAALLLQSRACQRAR